MSRPQQPTWDVVFQQTVKGLGGCVALLERFEPEFRMVRKDQFDEIVALMERINIVVGKMIDARTK